MPVIPMSLFQTVRSRLAGNFQIRTRTHDFALRGLFRCSLCKRSLIGETQKGNVYYRCHTKLCLTRTFREELLEEAMLRSWMPFAVTDEWKQKLSNRLNTLMEQNDESGAERTSHLHAQIARVKTRLTSLVDALLDGVLDKQSFDIRKAALLEEQASLEACLRVTEVQPVETKQFILQALELASSAQQSYRVANKASRRELAIKLLRGVNYFCRLATTISAGEGSAKERRPPPGGTRLLSSAGWQP